MFCDINDVKFSFNHIGFAVFSIRDTAEFYINGGGYTLGPVIYDPIQNVNIAFLLNKLMPTIELVEPVSNQSPVYKLLKKSGVTAYHVCFSVENINIAIKKLCQIGFTRLSDAPVEAIAMNNKKICFLYSKNTGLIELVEGAL
jgi:methylmalonyl-CoA/ethylmalonyl-CoA epimerase